MRLYLEAGCLSLQGRSSWLKEGDGSNTSDDVNRSLHGRGRGGGEEDARLEGRITQKRGRDTRGQRFNEVRE